MESRYPTLVMNDSIIPAYVTAISEYQSRNMILTDILKKSSAILKNTVINAVCWNHVILFNRKLNIYFLNFRWWNHKSMQHFILGTSFQNTCILFDNFYAHCDPENADPLGIFLNFQLIKGLMMWT